MKFSKLLLLMILPSYIFAIEVTVQNDSLVDNSAGAIQVGFVAGEQAAVWLDAPCDGNIVAAQVLWRSQTGGAPQSIEDSIKIYDSGIFPNPGALLETISGPVMTDGVINEFRFLDDNSVIPLLVPVISGETYIMAFTFLNTPSVVGPSLITDIDGCQNDKNSIFAIPPSTWLNSCLLGLSGDFVMRVVVDCAAAPSTIDLAISKDSMSSSYVPGTEVTYSIIASNAGPSVATSATVIDFFPNDLSNISWVCSGQNGAICTNASGNGNITESINLPVNSSLTYDAIATVDVNATGVLSNTAQIVVPSGLTDTDLNNNSATKDIGESMELIFSNGFEN